LTALKRAASRSSRGQRLAAPPTGTNARDAAEKTLAQPFAVLEGVLGGSSHLLGGQFTVADLNVASILAWARPAQIDFSAFPKLADWLKNCAERPAARAARQLQRE